jgi:hypothetical protein
MPASLTTRGHRASPALSPEPAAEPGYARTAVSLLLLLAVLAGSWGLLIGGVIAVYRLFT